MVWWEVSFLSPHMVEGDFLFALSAFPLHKYQRDPPLHIYRQKHLTYPWQYLGWGWEGGGVLFHRTYTSILWLIFVRVRLWLHSIPRKCSKISHNSQYKRDNTSNCSNSGTNVQSLRYPKLLFCTSHTAFLLINLKLALYGVLTRI